MGEGIGRVRGGGGGTKALDIAMESIHGRKRFLGEVGEGDGIRVATTPKRKLGHLPRPSGENGAFGRAKGSEKTEGGKGAVDVGNAIRHGTDELGAVGIVRQGCLDCSGGRLIITRGNDGGFGVMEGDKGVDRGENANTGEEGI